MAQRSHAIVLLGRSVRAARDRRGLTQEDVAGRSELDRTYISDVELGKRNVTILSLRRIAAALETSSSHLLADAEQRERDESSTPEPGTPGS